MPELMVDLIRLRLIENGLASLASKASSIQRGLSSASPDRAVAGRRSIGMRLTRANQRMIELERRLRSVQTFTAQAAGQYDAAATEVERRAVIEHGTSVVMKRYAGAAGGASGKTLSPEQLAALSLLGQLALAAVQGSLQGPAMLGAMVAGGGASRKNSGSQGLYIPDHLANEVLGRYTEDEHSAYVYKLPDGTVLPVDVNKASELIGQFNQISNEQITGYAEVMTGYSEAVPAFLAFAAEQGYDVRTFMPDGHSAINDYYIQLRSGEIAFYEEAYAKPFREQLLQGASTASDLIPIIGTIKGVIEVVSGRDPVTGKSLSAGERTLSAVFTLASLLPVTGIMKTAFKPFTKNADAVPDIGKRVGDAGIGVTPKAHYLETVNKFEDQIRNQPLEHGQFFDKNGNLIGETVVGTEKSINLSKHKDIAKDTVFTHNHPTNGPFSLEDIATAVDFNMAEIRAVSPNGTTLSMKRGADGWKVNAEELGNTFANVQKELRNNPLAQEYFKTGNKDAVWDMLFDRVAEKIGGEYKAHRK